MDNTPRTSSPQTSLTILEAATTSSGDIDYSDLIQAAQSGDKVQALIESLVPHFSIESIPAGVGWSRVVCMHDESRALNAVRDAFVNELGYSKKLPTLSERLSLLLQRHIISRVGFNYLCFKMDSRT